MDIVHAEAVNILRKRNYTEPTKIGSGSFGAALLVNDARGNKLVCKMVDVSQASRKEVQDAIKEGQLMASFRHPFIVQFHGSFIDSGWLCIVMGYCEGGDLAAQIALARETSQPFPEEKILTWTTQALLAIKYIHGRHVLHRDVKSSNFFLSKNHNLKMGDFGVAKVLSSTGACARTQTGTLNYLSPEVCQDRPYTWPSDIWAMGCVLYEMCALRMPFEAPDIMSLVQKICRGPIPLPESSEILRFLCSEMLNRTTSSRPSAKALLQQQAIKDIIKKMLTKLHDEEAAATTRHGTLSPCENCKYAFGSLVEYKSNSHGGWLQARIIDVDCNGQVTLDIKPNTWIPVDVQAHVLRSRSSNDAACEPSEETSAAVEASTSLQNEGDAARVHQDSHDVAPLHLDDEVFKLCDELGIDQSEMAIEGGIRTPPTPSCELDDSFTADERALLAEIDA
eukprot:TRINITY_DN23223_c0_g2_i5.p1 TRINITY_DN23223_c0_g2~~TRINITY_DN23223_c0_g2_i5.p1  ORF type:complete len:451 (+),score=39.28 TRINITY_DN23223_c0_g2_i5:120-1472(+)